MPSFHLLGWQEIQSAFWESPTPNHSLRIVQKPHHSHQFWRAGEGPFSILAHVTCRPVAPLLLCHENRRVRAGGPFWGPPMVPGYCKEKSANIHHSWYLQRSGSIPASSKLLPDERGEIILVLLPSFCIAEKNWYQIDFPVTHLNKVIYAKCMS